MADRGQITRGAFTLLQKNPDWIDLQAQMRDAFSCFLEAIQPFSSNFTFYQLLEVMALVQSGQLGQARQRANNAFHSPDRVKGWAYIAKNTGGIKDLRRTEEEIFSLRKQTESPISNDIYLAIVEALAPYDAGWALRYLKRMPEKNSLDRASAWAYLAVGCPENSDYLRFLNWIADRSTKADIRKTAKSKLLWALCEIGHEEKMMRAFDFSLPGTPLIWLTKGLIKIGKIQCAREMVVACSKNDKLTEGKKAEIMSAWLIIWGHSEDADDRNRLSGTIHSDITLFHEAEAFLRHEHVRMATNVTAHQIKDPHWKAKAWLSILSYFGKKLAEWPILNWN